MLANVLAICNLRIANGGYTYIPNGYKINITVGLHNAGLLGIAFNWKVNSTVIPVSEVPATEQKKVQRIGVEQYFKRTYTGLNFEDKITIYKNITTKNVSSSEITG